MTGDPQQPHAPVMLGEVIAALDPAPGALIVDGTLGAGGYTRAILDAGASVIAFDRDPAAITAAAAWSGPYKDRLTLVQQPFGEMSSALATLDVAQVGGVVLDIGVSSMQLDQAARGFSFRADGPLSMRMDSAKPDAADLINAADADDLSSIFKVYGEERFAGRLARAIVTARDAAPIETTGRLADVIVNAHPRRHEEKIHPATRVFQAIRIFVNDELGELARALLAAERLLEPAGRLVVVTFHSLEDRLVKRFFTDRVSMAGGGGSRHAPAAAAVEPALFELPRKKPVVSSADEIAVNPRARSAKLRMGVRTNSPAPTARMDFSQLLPRLSLSAAMQNWSMK